MRAKIVTDVFYQRDTMLHDKIVISYGKRNENWATDKLLSKSPGKENNSISTDECKVIETKKSLVFYSQYLGGAIEATLNFIKTEEGLKSFLKKVWKI